MFVHVFSHVQETLRLEKRAALVRSIQLGDVTAVLAALEKVDEPLTSLGWFSH